MESLSYLIPVPRQDEKPGLHRMIRQIQTRPGMYIGSNTITSLEHFLDGYQAAERDFGVGVCRNGNLFPPDFYYMHNFADFRLQTKCLCAGWRHNILTYCHGDEEKALNLFFDLYQEFRQLKMKRYWKAVLTKENIAWNDKMKRCYSVREHGPEPVYKNPIAVYALELTIPVCMLAVETTNEVLTERQFFSSAEEAKGNHSGAEIYFGKIDIWEEVEASNLYFDKVIRMR
ncbi:MAG: hypothetical protein K2N46_08870 [Lachnospiraceae bacterium]|nr:hypothetical protein [Lachnospiraceae bacterium]